MPVSRIPGRPAPTTATNQTDKITVDNTNAPATANTSQQLDRFEHGTRQPTSSPSTSSASTGQSKSVLRTMFAPYDSTTAAELEQINEVISAKQADSRTFPDGENPYSIKYAVYNLRNPEIIEALIHAEEQGVDVQVLIEDHQLDPKKTWNTADEQMQEAGFSFSGTHKGLSNEQKKELDMIGIEGSGLMHLKTRLFSYPDPETGKPIEKVMTGSMNPGDSAANNDETLHLINDPQLVSRYKAKYDAVLDGKSLPNEWSPDAAVNVLFTPATKGPQAADKILEMIDKEDEAIFLGVFSLRNVESPKQRERMVDKLKKAKERGVPVVVVTDRKQSDGVDAQGNKVGWDDNTEDLLKQAGIPVYECTNEAGQFNAMHAKYGIFGLSDMKVISDCGNWTKAALGGRRKKARNDESYLFIDSKKLDDNATGMRYLSNFLQLIRKYDDQQTGVPNADTLFDTLSQHPNWPKVKVDFDVLAQTYYGEEIYITGDHPAFGNWTQEGPGLKLNTDGESYPNWSTDTAIELPFGTELEYKIVRRDSHSGELRWEPGQNQLLLVDPVHQSGDQEGALSRNLDVKDRFGHNG
ncbi:MAG: hypothetical protein CL920_39555 [Deltaproteobacteria bacterium]|nr:hypothetical protein [Deltaproteobacteria bacterium]MBU54832.1 hypothetical protein [Deltaproteobacteria bacterium]